MVSTLEIVTLWIILSLFSFSYPVFWGIGRLWSARKRTMQRRDDLPLPLIEVLVPVKGVGAEQESALRSLLQQTYPRYRVAFIVEDELDPALAVVETLCRLHPHGHVVMSGLGAGCAQKNHNLIAGVRQLDQHTEIIVFCDSTNVAQPDWLTALTAPLRSGAAEVVSTFRAFHPEPQNLGGLCQAIYAACVLVLLTLKAKPWGGATGILRTTFDRLDVIETWSHAVVDDLTLGNLLDREGIKVYSDVRLVLESPVHGQSIQGYLSYLDRQILFPKWTNPGIWVTTVFGFLNTTAAFLVALLVAVLYPLGLVEASLGWAGYSFVCCTVLVVLGLRWTNPYPLSVWRWLAAIVPCAVLTAFACARSIYARHIDWHGRRYVPGRGGVVLDVSDLNGGPPARVGQPEVL